MSLVFLLAEGGCRAGAGDDTPAQGGSSSNPTVATVVSARHVVLPPDVTHLSGIVGSVDLRRGILDLDAGGASVRVRGEPASLVWIPGAVITVDVVRYGEAPWLPLTNPLPSMAHTALWRGTVTDVDKATGALSLDGRTVRAHPERLRGVLPGQRVRVRVVSMGDEGWAVALGPEGS